MEAARLGQGKVDEERQPFGVLDDLFDLAVVDSADGNVTERAELDGLTRGGRRVLPDD